MQLRGWFRFDRETKIKCAYACFQWSGKMSRRVILVIVAVVVVAGGALGWFIFRKPTILAIT